MPKNSSARLRQHARALADQLGISYAAALRQLTAPPSADQAVADPQLGTQRGGPGKTTATMPSHADGHAVLVVDGVPRTPYFADDDFRSASRSARTPDGTRHVHVARRDGYVQLRSASLAGTAEYAATAVTMAEAQFDAYQLGARRGYPTGTPLQITVHPDTQDYLYRNGETGAEGTVISDEDGFLCFLDGVFRGEFGGPDAGRSNGLTSGGLRAGPKTKSAVLLAWALELHNEEPVDLAEVSKDQVVLRG